MSPLPAASADAVRAGRLGARFKVFLAVEETALTAAQKRLLALIGVEIRAQAPDIAAFTTGRFTQPPLSLGGLISLRRRGRPQRAPRADQRSRLC